LTLFETTILYSICRTFVYVYLRNTYGSLFRDAERFDKIKFPLKNPDSFRSYL